MEYILVFWYQNNFFYQNVSLIYSLLINHTNFVWFIINAKYIMGIHEIINFQNIQLIKLLPIKIANKRNIIIDKCKTYKTSYWANKIIVQPLKPDYQPQLLYPRKKKTSSIHLIKNWGRREFRRWNLFFFFLDKRQGFVP